MLDAAYTVMASLAPLVPATTKGLIEVQVNAGSTRDTARILLTEDNEINQQVATEVLRGAGFVVEIANNGQEPILYRNDGGRCQRPAAAATGRARGYSTTHQQYCWRHVPQDLPFRCDHALVAAFDDPRDGESLALAAAQLMGITTQRFVRAARCWSTI